MWHMAGSALGSLLVQLVPRIMLQKIGIVELGMTPKTHLIGLVPEPQGCRVRNGVIMVEVMTREAICSPLPNTGPAKERLRNKTR